MVFGTYDDNLTSMIYEIVHSIAKGEVIQIRLQRRGMSDQVQLGELNMLGEPSGPTESSVIDTLQAVLDCRSAYPLRRGGPEHAR